MRFLGFRFRAGLRIWDLRFRVLGFRFRALGFRVYLNPKSMQNNSPKPIIIAITAIILHTLNPKLRV